MRPTIQELISEKVQQLKVSLLEQDLRIAEEHNAWMKRTPFNEAARIFSQFGEAPPEVLDTEPLKEALSKARFRVRQLPLYKE